MSHDLVVAIAGDARECRIHIDDLGTGICDDDALITVGIDTGSQAQLTVAFAQICCEGFQFAALQLRIPQCPVGAQRGVHGNKNLVGG